VGRVGSVPVSGLYVAGSTVTVVGNTGGLAVDDYSFIGWLYDGVVYNAGESFVIDENVELVAQWVTSGGVTKVVDGGSGSYVSGASVDYVVSYTVPSGVGVISSFEVVDSWSPVAGLSYTGVVVKVNNVVVTTGFTVTSVAGQVNVTFVPSSVKVGDVVVVTLSFTVADVSKGISNEAEVFINGNPVGDDDADLFGVTYLPGGAGVTGSVPVDVNLYSSGASVTVLGQGSLSWSGYRFIGWLYDGVVYNAGESFVIDENVELVAQWKFTPVDLVFYSITYDGNGFTGGSVPVDDSLYPAENYVLVMGPGNMTREGYVFLGWALSPSATAADYVEGYILTIRADVTLFAVWEQVASDPLYTVTYSPGTHGTFDSVTYECVFGVPTPAAPVVTGEGGWMFIGWSPVPSDTVEISVEYVAQWVPADDIVYMVHYYLIGTSTSLAPSKTVTGQTLGDMVTEWAVNIAGYTVDEESKSLVLEESGNEIIFYYTPNNDIEYVVHYYLQGTSTSVAPSKTVTGQTMGARITENAITITGYTAVAPTSLTATLNATGNVFVFYYSANPSDNNSGGTSTNRTPAKTTPPPATPSVPSEVTPPPKNTDPPVDPKPLSYWALVNLILSIVGLILAIVVTICVLLQRKQKQNKQQEIEQEKMHNSKGKYATKQNQQTIQTTKEDKEKEEEEQKKKKQRRLFWYLLSVIMGIAGIIVFILTEDMRLPMRLVDWWTIVNLVIFIIELIAIALIFKREKKQKTEYTVNYYLQGTETPVALSKTVQSEVDVGLSITEYAPNIEGYILVGDKMQSLILDKAKDENVITFYYAVMSAAKNVPVENKSIQ
jgi:fimbrial isopeptide formation D2 family protein